MVEYMPAAFSRYSTTLSIATTGCRMLQFMNPRKSADPYTIPTRASKPVVGSSINIMEGLATSSTAIVSLLRCSADRPVAPGMPTMAFFKSYPEILENVSCFLGYPAILIVPSIYPPVFLPANTSSNVVFPAPVIPIRAVCDRSLYIQFMNSNANMLRMLKTSEYPNKMLTQIQYQRHSVSNPLILRIASPTEKCRDHQSHNSNLYGLEYMDRESRKRTSSGRGIGQARINGGLAISSSPVPPLALPDEDDWPDPEAVTRLRLQSQLASAASCDEELRRLAGYHAVSVEDLRAWDGSRVGQRSYVDTEEHTGPAGHISK
ncbi:hypothetical protein U9M48_037937 [Paspalum notatum var. saurae]|uniref:Uncharacterized protein n=1 Tax=Paspalum notatum var. saurae TaxID=547442 RepID=A0AAQ3XBM9_PASNO